MRGKAGFFSGLASPAPMLLLHFDGANNATTTDDSSLNDYTVEFYGDAKISTDENKFGGSSLFLDGDGDFLSIEGFSSLDFTSGNWTLEAWIYPTNGFADRPILAMWDNGLKNFILGIADGSAWLRWFSLNEPQVYGGSVSENQWCHLAATRSGNTGRLFVDGTLVGTLDLEGDAILGPGSELRIGKTGVGYDAAAFEGYIDEVRVTQGTALYETSFTPPTSPFPDA